jgi:hypothetical protein
MTHLKGVRRYSVKHPKFLYVIEEKGCASIIYEGCPKCFPELSVLQSKSMGNVCFYGLF